MFEIFQKSKESEKKQTLIFELLFFKVFYFKNNVMHS